MRIRNSCRKRLRLDVIQLGNKTKLTADVEKLFVELGGGDPNKTYSREELSAALVNAIEALPDGSPILEKLYRHMVASGAIDAA